MLGIKNILECPFCGAKDWEFDYGIDFNYEPESNEYETYHHLICNECKREFLAVYNCVFVHVEYEKHSSGSKA